jgi:hypothetical protein
MPLFDNLATEANDLKSFLLCFKMTYKLDLYSMTMVCIDYLFLIMICREYASISEIDRVMWLVA